MKKLFVGVCIISSLLGLSFSIALPKLHNEIQVVAQSELTDEVITYETEKLNKKLNKQGTSVAEQADALVQHYEKMLTDPKTPKEDIPKILKQLEVAKEMKERVDKRSHS